MPKITIEIEVTDEDLRAGHYQLMFGGEADDGGSMDPQDLWDFHLRHAVTAKLHALRSKMRWKTLEIGKSTKLQRDDNGVRVRVRDPREGHWKCRKSPTGVCWYDDRTDPCWDDCVFCEEPNERK